MEKVKRSQFITRTGAIAAAVGSAVGLGNIWRFPYEAGMHGGGAFLIIYILCVFAIGIPVMVAEFALGRGTRSGGVGAFRQLAPHSPLRISAISGIIASLMILSFYSVVAGWILEYLFQSIGNIFSPAQPEQYAERFANFISNPWGSTLWTVLFLVLNFVVLRRGVEKGIEKMSNILMPALALLLIVFCVNSLLMSGAGEGLIFLFRPDFSEITPSTVIGAMGQAFFSLSIGLTCMLTYASYFSDKTNLRRSATIIALLDTLVAIVAGVIIFPAVFTYGMQPEAGPKLVFEILPSIFAQMPLGEVWSAAFFLLLAFAALTSTISMSEISIAYFIEERKMSRSKAVGVNTLICGVFGVLCALSFGPLSDVTICGQTIFNLFDYVSSNILLPCGGIMLSIFAGWVVDKRFLEKQLSAGEDVGSSRTYTLLRFCIRWIAPIGIAIIFIYNLL